MSYHPTEPASSAAAARGGDDSSSSSSRPSSSSYKLPPILARPAAPTHDDPYRPLQPPSREDTNPSRGTSGRGTPPSTTVSPTRRSQLPPLSGFHESRPFSLPSLATQHHNQPPVLPPLVASAPAIPTKGSLQVRSDSPASSSSSHWPGFSTKRPPLAPLHSSDRYDHEQTDRFGLFRGPPPQLSYTSSSRANSTGHPSDVSSSYNRDRGSYFGHHPPSDASSNSPIDYPRRLPSPRSAHPYSSYREVADSSRSPERTYQRLKPSPVIPHQSLPAAAAAAAGIPPPTQAQIVRSGQGRTFIPPETPPTLDETFAMLKGTKFTGKFASVGLQGPPNLPEQLAKARLEVEASRSSTAGGKSSGKPEIWADDAEYAFLAAEIYLPTSVNSKVQFFGKACGRNEIIGLIITMAIGKLMTRKQVSSHLQVVRQRKNVNECVKWMVERYGRDQKEPSQGSTINQLGGLHPYLYEIMGVDPSVDLAETPKPAWISALEDVHPGAEYGGALRTHHPMSNDGSRRDSSGSPPRVGRSQVPSRNATMASTYRAPQQRQSVSSSDDERRTLRYPSRVKSSSESDEDLHAHKRPRRSNTPPVDSVATFAPRVHPPRPAAPSSSHQHPPGHPPYTELDTVELKLETKDRGRIILARASFPTGPRRDRSFGTIPLANARYRGIHALVEKYKCKVVHVEATIDVDNVLPHFDSNILIDLGLYAKGKGNGGVNDVFVASTSGYLVGAFGTIGIVHISDVVANEERDTFRTAIPFSEQKLPRLIQEQAQPQHTILPQYWIMQEVFTTGFPKSVLVGSRLSEGHCISPAAVAAQEIGLVVIYSLHAGTSPLAGTAVVENVVFD